VDSLPLPTPLKRLSAVARGIGSPRRAANRRRRVREDPEPACVQSPSDNRGGTCRGGRVKNILPWYRLVGVVRTSIMAQASVDAGGKPGLTLFSERGSGHHVVRGRQSSPKSLPRGQGQEGKRQGKQARLAKTVKVQVLGGSSPWIRPSAPGCGDAFMARASLWESSSLTLGGDHPADGLGVAIDWVVGRSHPQGCIARRLNVQSGPRKFPTPVGWGGWGGSVAFRDRGY